MMLSQISSYNIIFTVLERLVSSNFFPHIEIILKPDSYKNDPPNNLPFRQLLFHRNGSI